MLPSERPEVKALHARVVARYERDGWPKLRGTPEECAAHQLEVFHAMTPLRLAANTIALADECEGDNMSKKNARATVLYEEGTVVLSDWLLSRIENDTGWVRLTYWYSKAGSWHYILESRPPGSKDVRYTALREDVQLGECHYIRRATKAFDDMQS